MFKEFIPIGIVSAFCAYFLGKMNIEFFNSFKTIGSNNILGYTNLYKICQVDIRHFCAGSTNLYFFIFLVVFLVLLLYFLLKIFVHIEGDARRHVQDIRKNCNNLRDFQDTVSVEVPLSAFFFAFALLLSVTVPFYSEGFSFRRDPFLSLANYLGNYWFIMFAFLLSFSVYSAYQVMISKRGKKLAMSSNPKDFSG